MYINSVRKDFTTTNVKYFPSNQCYIGADPSISSQSFKGGIDNIKLYSGANSEEHIYAEYHVKNFPEYEGNLYKFEIGVDYDGEVAYDIVYPDIEDVTPLDTVEENTTFDIKIPYEFKCRLDFIPHAGKILNYYSILKIKKGSVISRKDEQICLKDSISSVENKYKVEAYFGELVLIDDFESDNGWQVNPDGTDDADSGIWERKFPFPNDFHLPPVEGLNIFVTGYNNAKGNVDGGVTSIRSPQIQLPSTGQINMNVNYYFFHDSLATSNDYLQVIIEGSTDSTELLDIRGIPGEEISKEKGNEWELAVMDISDYAGETITILIKAADNDNNNIIEAGIDYLKIVNTGN